MAALIVNLLVTVPWKPPNADSAMPPPRAEPMPPSDFAGWASTRRIRNSETKIRMTVRIPRRILMEPKISADTDEGCQCAVQNGDDSVCHNRWWGGVYPRRIRRKAQLTIRVNCPTSLNDVIFRSFCLRVRGHAGFGRWRLLAIVEDAHIGLLPAAALLFQQLRCALQCALGAHGEIHLGGKNVRLADLCEQAAAFQHTQDIHIAAADEQVAAGFTQIVMERLHGHDGGGVEVARVFHAQDKDADI